MADEVLVEFSGRVAIMTINRPQARNAVNHAVSAAVAQALDDLDERDDLTVGIITGAGGTFSSGMDLKAFLAGENVAIPGRGLAGLTQRPPAKPLIAAVERIAVNGPLAVAATKQIIGQQFDWQLAEVWEKQEPIMRPAFQSQDAREGALAFAEKRPPVWQGR
jgi:enoyl-CoA hydratase